MPDYPDHTKPITITGVTIETLPIDIKTQTAKTIAVDIAAQTAEAIVVNIGTGAVSVSDINTVKDGDFEADGLGWTLENGAHVATDWPKFGLKCLRFPGVSWTEYATSPIIAPAVPTDNVDSITLWMKVAEVTDKLGIAVNYTDGTWTETVLTNVAPGYEARSVNFEAGKFINMIEIWWEDLVTPYGVWVDSVSIVLKAAVRMDIVSSVTINMHIKSQEVDINIKTSSGVNLVIDKLTQTAYIARGSTLKNDNDVTTPTAPPNSLTASTFRGKFFPRGCRGFLDTLQIYCKRTAAGTLTLAYAPQLYMGEIGTVTITPGADWDWKEANVRKLWNYDALFIWVKTCDADVSFGYDTVTSQEGFYSTDSGVTWISSTSRYYIRAVMKGETVGDLPVSGTINTVEIPNLAGVRQNQLITVPAASIVYDTVQPGSGRLLVAYFIAWTSGARDNLRPRILCDGVSVLPFAWTFEGWSFGISTTSIGITLSQWDTTEHRYVICVLIPYPFKRSLQLGFGNISPDTEYQGYIGYCWVKIS